MAKFKDIPQMTRSGTYSVNVFWPQLIWQLQKWENEKLAPLDMSPDFQRPHVWNEEKQKRYVEYILRGGKYNREILFNCVGWGRKFEGPFVLVDGKQRIEAARKFLQNELQVFDGLLFDDFEDEMSFEIDFVFKVNDLATRAEVLQWYIDVNSGGVVHTNEEIEKVRQLLEKESSII